MRVLTPETKVGLFTIIAGIALLYMSFKTAGVSFFGDEERMRFYINFTSIAGVEEMSKVSLSGVEIGQVELIELEDDHAKVTIKLTRDAIIRKDSTATIKTAGLLGESYIALIQGSKTAAWLKDGETLEKSVSAPDIGDLMGSIKEIITENREALNKLLTNLLSISNEFVKTAPVLSENLERAVVSLREVIEENRGNLGEAIENTKKLMAEFRDMLKENRANIKSTFGNIAGASAKMDDLMVSLGNMSKSIEKVAGKIERGEGTIGKLVTEDEIYVNLNKTLKGASWFLNKTGKIGFYLGLRAERQVEFNQSQAYLSLKIQPREDRFYLIEVSEDVRSDESEGAINSFNSLLFTVVAAKRFSDLTIRGGLIESSAGLGFDYHLFGDSIVVTTDIFNLSGYDKEAPDPQIKAMLKWNFLDYLYLYAGGDELLNDNYRTFIIGGGIMFNDDDLKFALGLL